ncbi:LytR/AlgR family response regulator transcription factor [Flavilitoribacter nigricans]|uniref:DNA-binding response regulator n=1 Tax=Flavilitoribacter nigricans (strain ATCC 23147 / DSM 23189 / NBRC 102662 / NCIMB 1420 / SS-2) TaxID=1122177 RepID=A0A2D0N1V9_FLAN2|nr:LytTR family DNA-binding domain-containing protein [Flavilitoribacter nigricans]PHN02356.1 DNA-binding response regulator [Flavilitoribacter nigricans DSM 23189 = NBRC 102662]
MSLKRIRSLIIDDDPFIHNLLRDKLQQHIPQVEVVATANSGEEGLQAIEHFKPEVIFLDVEMPDMTGFEMLQKLNAIPFQIIFITSYRHYAIKAIRFNALDYLTKPIDLGELKNAIKRCRAKLGNASENNPLKQALINLKTKNAADQTLILHTQEGSLHIQLSQIIRIEGERNYSRIYLVNQKKKIASKTLKDLEEILDDKGFFRCHKSHLINARHILAYPTRYSLMLSDQTLIPVARRKREAFRDWHDRMVDNPVKTLTQ